MNFILQLNSRHLQLLKVYGFPKWKTPNCYIHKSEDFLYQLRNYNIAIIGEGISLALQTVYGNVNMKKSKNNINY